MLKYEAWAEEAMESISARAAEAQSNVEGQLFGEQNVEKANIHKVSRKLSV